MSSPITSDNSEAQRAERAYLAHMRHELRTPLNAILGYSEMLLEDAADSGDDRFCDDLQKINRGGHQLLELVNEILHASKIDAGPLDIEALGADIRHQLRTPLNAVIGYCELLEEDAAEESEMLAEIVKIHQSADRLCALIDDIVQFSGLGGAGATCDGASKVLSDAEVSTSDAALTSDAVVQDMIQDVVASIPALVPDDENARLTGRLLVVDDNAVNRDLLSRRLERNGHSVETCEDGATALERIKNEEFDLILLDIMMPGLNGYQVLERLKSDADLRHIPVIMISALDEIDSVVRCIEIGAEDYLAKPFNPVLLKARVGAGLEKKRLRDQEVRLWQQLEANYQKLQELEGMRDSLTHMIVHDLRTPLTSLTFGMQLMGNMGELNETQAECLDISIKGAQTLLSMINDLLDVSKMESGTLQLEYATIVPQDLAQQCLAQVEELARTENQTLETRMDVENLNFEGDEDKLRRTLVNLLGNALKFTPSGGSVTLACETDAVAQTIKFSVIDTGEGIPAEDFAKIFEKFGQVEGRKGGRKMSSGLGLTFCKMAVEAHGGQIDVQSTLGQGSTFSFWVPMQRPTSPTEPSSAEFSS